ncbi:MAG: type II secretion system protein [Planctomycetes bacterium]|nr:type II secretion system protein [Planctomycetota bacterium]
MRFVRAMTLIELIAVVAIIGILSAVVLMRVGDGSFGRPSVNAFTRQLSVDLRYTRSMAITQKVNHYLGFDSSGYTIFRRDSPDVVVHPRQPLPKGVGGSISAWNFEFEPSGAALAGYWANLSSSGVTYRVEVILVTGTTTVRKL